MQGRFLLGLSVFLFAFVVNLGHYGEPLGWDPAVYLDNGHFFYGDVYLYDELRPPVYPFLLGSLMQFTEDVRALELFDFAVRALAVLLLFRLSARFVGDRLALAVAALFLLNPIVAAVPPFMVEFAAMAALLASLVSYYKIKDSERPPVWCFYSYFVFAMLAFLSRYPLAIYLPVMLYQIASQREKFASNWRHAAAGVALSVSLLCAWLAWNWAVFGDPFLSFVQAFVHINLDVQSQPWYFYFSGFDSNILVIFSFSLVLLALAAVKLCREKDLTLPLFLLLNLAFITLTGRKLPRYLFFFIGFAYVLVFYGYRALDFPVRKKRALLAVLLVLLAAPFFFMNPPAESGREATYEQGKLVGEFLPPDAVLGAYDSPQIALFSGRKTYTVHGDLCEYLECPGLPVSFATLWDCERVDYVVSSSPLDYGCLEPAYTELAPSVYVYEWR